MFARTVSMRVKAGKARDLVAMIEAEFIPRLRREEGFQDALILVAADGTEAIGLSLWSQRSDVDRYERNAAVQMTRRLAEFLDAVGTPQVLQVWNSTFHQIDKPLRIGD